MLVFARILSYNFARARSVLNMFKTLVCIRIIWIILCWNSTFSVSFRVFSSYFVLKKVQNCRKWHESVYKIVWLVRSCTSLCTKLYDWYELIRKFVWNFTNLTEILNSSSFLNVWPGLMNSSQNNTKQEILQLWKFELIWVNFVNVWLRH